DSIWRRPAVHCPRFEKASREFAFAPGMGLPGRIWTSGKPAWVPDIAHDDNFPRAPVALEEGLHGAFGCPITYGDAILGVVEFFSADVREPDDDLLEIVGTLGGQIGQFMDRQRVLTAVRDSEARKTAILQTTLDGILTIDAQGHIVEFNPAAERIFGRKA